MTILRKRLNQYLTVKVEFASFPEEIKVREYEFFGHLQGQRLNRVKGMNVFDFDLIIWLRNSVNAKKEVEFIHCGGMVYGSTDITPIVLRKKKIQTAQ